MSSGAEEIQRRWLSPSISKLSAYPVIIQESVKLAKLEEILARAAVSHARPTLSMRSSVWSTISKHEFWLPQMMLFSRYDGSSPLASQSRPPLSPFKSSPYTVPSISSNLTA